MATNTEAGPGETLARDIMTREVVSVPPDMSVKELVGVFRDKRVGGVPVVEDGKLVGIVTEGDLMAMDADIHYPHYFELFDSVIYLGSQKKFKDQLEKAAAATVRDLMTEKVKTVAPGDPARKGGHADVGPQVRPRARGGRERRAGGHHQPSRHHQAAGAVRCWPAASGPWRRWIWRRCAATCAA